MVVLYHFELALFPGFEEMRHKDTKHIILNLSPTAYGWIGVQLFLIISGFLIHLGFLSRNGSLNTSAFYSKRFWRIYPPYLIVLLIFFATAIGIKNYSYSNEGYKDLFVHLFFIHNLFDKYYFSINPSFWSLALEMQLYLIYPIFLFIRKWLGIKKTIIIIFLLTPASYFAVQSIAPHSKLVAQGFVFNNWFTWCAGAFLAERYINGQRLFGKFSLTIALLGSVATILSGFFIAIELSGVIAIFASIAFFEWLLHKEINIKTPINKALAIIGIVSYSIYLIHQPLIHLAIPWFNFLGPKAYWAFIKPIPIFISIFIISYFSYRFIELPSIRLGYLLRKKNRTSNLSNQHILK